MSLVSAIAGYYHPGLSGRDSEQDVRGLIAWVKQRGFNSSFGWRGGAYWDQGKR